VIARATTTAVRAGQGPADDDRDGRYGSGAAPFEDSGLALGGDRDHEVYEGGGEASRDVVDRCVDLPAGN
jgi:hypothetical protein